MYLGTRCFVFFVFMDPMFCNFLSSAQILKEIFVFEKELPFMPFGNPETCVMTCNGLLTPPSHKNTRNPYPYPSKNKKTRTPLFLKFSNPRPTGDGKQRNVNLMHRLLIQHQYQQIKKQMK